MGNGHTEHCVPKSDDSEGHGIGFQIFLAMLPTVVVVTMPEFHLLVCFLLFRKEF